MPFDILPPRRASRDLTWQAPPFTPAKRTIVWYASLVAITFVLVGFSVWQRNLFFGIFVVLAAFLVGGLNRRTHEPLEFSVGPEGIRVGTIEYRYDEFSEFSYRSRPGQLDHIILWRKSTMSTHIHLPVEATLGGNVRAFLAERVSEVDHPESFIDLFSDFLGL